METKKRELTIDAKSTTGSFELTNFNELKNQVQELSDKYNNWVITREDVEQAKEIKAKINKVSKGFDDRRKDLEKEYMKPFNVGKDQIKTLCSMLKETYENINKQLNAIEEEEKKERLQDILPELETIYSESKIKLDIEKLIKEEWLNKSAKKNQVIEEAVKVRDDLNTAYDLLKYVKPSVYKYEILYQFDKEFDIENVVATMTRVMNENATLHLIASKHLKEDREKEVENKQYEIRYIVNGSREDLKRLSELLKDYNFTYKVEKEEE